MAVHGRCARCSRCISTQLNSSSHRMRGLLAGAVHILHSLDVKHCAGEPWAFGPIVNVIDAYIKLPLPIEHVGALSLWRIGEHVLNNVQSASRRR